MKIHYDRQEDILLIEMADHDIDHADHTGPFIVHVGSQGQLVLLEILDASEFLSSVIKATLRRQEEEIPLSAS